MQSFIVGNGASSVLIRVLQQTEPIGYVQLQKEICYKKLAHVIMETSVRIHSVDQQSSRPRTSSGAVPVWGQPGIRKSDGQMKP